MRPANSQDRRRRLRLIKAVEVRTAKRARSAVAELTITSQTEAARLEFEAIQKKLIVECQVNLSARLQIEHLVAHPDMPPMDIRLDRPYLVIGSDPTCDVRLNHEEIKPRHFFLQWIEGHLFCCDIAPPTSLFPDRTSSNIGRWVNHQPIPLGPYQLKLRFDDGEIPVPPDFSPLDRSARLAAEYPLIALQFLGVEQQENVWPINRTLTLIGRSSQCKLRLNHKSIAQVQACLLRTANGCWLMDLASDGTTGINGHTIKVAPIDIADILRIGDFRIEVVTSAIPSDVPIAEKSTPKPMLPISFQRSQSNPTADLSPLSRPAVDRSPPDATDSTAALSRYVERQQSHLAMLKQRLDNLKNTYDAATGQLISKKMRDLLERPVLETLQCHDSMQAALAEFAQSVEQEADESPVH